MSTNMKQIYELVDVAIKEGLTQDKLLSLVKGSSGDQTVGTLFDLPSSFEYILKRFINACMSTDSEIRQHSSASLQKWALQSLIKPNPQKLAKYILDVSNYKKGGNKKSQSDAFAAGRSLLVKVLSDIFINNSKIFDSLSQVLKDFGNLEQQAIEACHLIGQNKVLKVKFQILSPQNTSSRFLHKLLLKAKNSKAQNIKIQDFSQVLEIETKNYPKISRVLYNFGKYLHIVTESPLEFFRQYANRFLDNDSETQVDFHQIFSILTVLKGFLGSNTINFSNYQTYFDKKIISVWLQQFRVLNKKMKALSKSINIVFQNNPDMAYNILVDLHEEGVYLDNISANHPLAQLYEFVNVEKYWKYVYNLCLESAASTQLAQKQPNQQAKNKENTKKNKKQKNQKQLQVKKEQQNIQQEQDEPLTFYNQLQFFMKLRFKELPEQCLCLTLILLLNQYHKNQKNKQLLYLCINLLNLICKITKKNKNKKLNTKILIVMNQIKIEQLEGLTERQVKIFRNATIWLKKNTIKIRKQPQYIPHPGQIDFFNFYSCLLCFCLIYPDQIETCKELQLVYQDLIAFYAKKSEIKNQQPKKKVKKQKNTQNKQQTQIDQQKKPIHVLTDIFISLMTKPPVFLRKSIHNLYENIIPFLDETDIGNMLTVITTPDAQFIEQI